MPLLRLALLYLGELCTIYVSTFHGDTEEFGGASRRLAVRAAVTPSPGGGGGGGADRVAGRRPLLVGRPALSRTPARY